jgi:hypothetical protein
MTLGETRYMGPFPEGHHRVTVTGPVRVWQVDEVTKARTHTDPFLIGGGESFNWYNIDPEYQFEVEATGVGRTDVTVITQGSK